MRAMQKTIGLLGGMSWESTASYYRDLNEGIKAEARRIAFGKNLPGERRLRGDREITTH